jgi:hypothetical protein
VAGGGEQLGGVRANVARSAGNQYAHVNCPVNQAIPPDKSVTSEIIKSGWKA